MTLCQRCFIASQASDPSHLFCLQWFAPLRQLVRLLTLLVVTAVAAGAYSSSASNANTVGKLGKGLDTLEKGLSDLRTEMRSDIAALDTKLSSELASLRIAMKQQRFYALGVTVLLAGAGGTTLYQALNPR